MSKVDEIPVGRPQSGPAVAADAMASGIALTDNDGDGVNMITTRCSIPQSTIYHRLDQFASQSPANPEDEPHQGRRSSRSISAR